SDAGHDPTNRTTRQACDLLATGFGSGFNGPLQLAVQLPAGRVAGDLAKLTTALRKTPGVASVAAPQLNPARDAAAIVVYPTTSPQSAATTSLVKHLRSKVLPPFAIVFGLSMDYEVFLVSRIHEEWRHRGDATAAVREGVASTGRVITAAAAVMVAVFISFATGDERALKLFGVALATAVFLDAIV